MVLTNIIGVQHDTTSGTAPVCSIGTRIFGEDGSVCRLFPFGDPAQNCLENCDFYKEKWMAMDIDYDMKEEK